MQRIKKKRYRKGHSTLTHARAIPNRMKKQSHKNFQEQAQQRSMARVGKKQKNSEHAYVIPQVVG